MKNIMRISGRKSLLYFTCILVIFVIIEPRYVEEFEILDGVINIVKYIVSILIVSYFIASRKKISVFLLAIIGFEISLLISTFLNRGSFWDWFVRGAYVLILAMFMQIMMDAEPRILLRAFSTILGLYVHINLLTRFLYPNGLFVSALEGYTTCWFLGYDNLSATIIILANTISLFRITANPHKTMLWDKTVLISGAVFLMMQMIATGILAEAVFFAFFFITRIRSVRIKLAKAKLIVIAMFVLFFLIQFFNVQQGGLFSVIFAILGKDTTITGRTWLWQKAWDDLFNGNMLLGMGIHNGLDYVEHFGRVFATHMHCNYLQVLYEGGIIGEIMLFIMLYIPSRRFDKMKPLQSSMAFLSGLTAILLIWQVEAYTTLITYFIIVLFLINYADRFETSV